MFNKVYLGVIPISDIYLGTVPIKYRTKKENIIAFYAVSNDPYSSYSPYEIVNKAPDWKEKVTDIGNGTSTVTITASYGPSRMSFTYKEKLLSIGYIDLSNITSTASMFRACTNLTSINGLTVTSNTTDINNMFSMCSNLITIDVSSWDTSNVTNISNIFESCSNLISIIGLDKWDVSNVTSMEGAFRCRKLTAMNVGKWDVSNVTSMRYMFQYSVELKSLDISHWDINFECDTSYMLNNCTSLEELRLDYCDSDTIRRIINSAGFPTFSDDSTHVIYCKEENAHYPLPQGWVYSFV